MSQPFNEKQDVNQTFSRHISDEQKIISRAQGLHAEVFLLRSQVALVNLNFTGANNVAKFASRKG